MVDVLTKKQRSYNMSRIKGKWTKQEKFLHNFLKGNKIKHTMHPNLPGKPDILIPDKNTVIFLDGCFWHKCPKCFKMPLTNTEFWKEKMEYNKKKDRSTTRKLKGLGYHVIRIWGHKIKNNYDIIDLISC